MSELSQPHPADRRPDSTDLPEAIASFDDLGRYVGQTLTCSAVRLEDIPGQSAFWLTAFPVTTYTGILRAGDRPAVFYIQAGDNMLTIEPHNFVARQVAVLPSSPTKTVR